MVSHSFTTAVLLINVGQHAAINASMIYENVT